MALKNSSSIGDYTILPVALPPTASYPVQATHHIYLRKHSPKISTPTEDRSLFLVNVPVDSTSQLFRAIFNTLVGAGRFESISFERDRHNVAVEEHWATQLENRVAGDRKRKRGQDSEVLPSACVELPPTWDRDLHKSGSTAIVVMSDSKSVESALKAARKACKSGQYPIWGETADGKLVKVAALGSKRYSTHHELKYPDKAELQASIDAYMAAFNSKEEAAARDAKKARGVPDEDGFVTVARGGRTGPARREEAEEARRKELEKEEEKKKSMGDFYRFQGRERRKEEQRELVKQFDEDRKRVEVLKAQRGKFRPE